MAGDAVTALGSAGARRVLAAANGRRGRALRMWDARVCCDAGMASLGPPHAVWMVNTGASGWQDCDRATARLLLAGLLGDAAVREFVAWVRAAQGNEPLHRELQREGVAEPDERLGGAVARSRGYADGAFDAFDDVLARLREMGVPT